MAKSRQQIIQEAPKSAAEIESERMMNELKGQEQRERLEAKVEDLANRTADYILKYGEEDYRTVMLMAFLDVSLMMKESIVLIGDMASAINCITEAMGCIDTIQTEMFNSFDSTLQQNYGVLARMRQRRHLRKVMKNNLGRMASLANNIVGGHKIAQAMVGAMQKVGLKIKLSVDKMNKKTQKENAKAIKKGEPIVSQSPAQVLVKEILSKRGDQNGGGADAGAADASPSPSVGGGAASAASSASAGGSSDGDIFKKTEDIL